MEEICVGFTESDEYIVPTREGGTLSSPGIVGIGGISGALDD